MALIISAGRFAITVTDEGRLTFWQGWRSLANEPGKARSALRMELARFDPDILVMEDPKQKRCRKGATQDLLLFMAQAAEDEPVRLVKLPRMQRYENRCAQIDAIVKRFPEVESWCCEKVPVFMTEPRYLIYFDCLDLTLRVIDAPPARDSRGLNHT